MLIPTFWRGRPKNSPAGSRLQRFQAVLRSAHAVPRYKDRLEAAGLRSPGDLDGVDDPVRVLDRFSPLAWEDYTECFRSRRPSWRRQPEQRQTRSGLMLRYPEARAGVESCRVEPPSFVDLYSAAGTAQATGDLYRLSKALETQPFDWESDHAMVLFSGMDAGLLAAEQRDQLWRQYKVPLFEHFLGTDGRVIASECEVHSGLHIRTEGAIVESADGQIIVTSLTDEESPAIRVHSGFSGFLATESCECGRDEPRIVDLATKALPHSRTVTA